VRIAITGASGLLGSALASELRGAGGKVVALVRWQPRGAGEVGWDPAAADGGLDPAALSGLDAVVHLAGAPIAAGRWTPARKQVLRASRVDSTRVLVSAMLAAAEPPPVLLAGSAIGWYGDTGGQAVDESAPYGRGFLAELVRDWEAAAGPASAAGIRVVHLRSGVVLSSRGGMLPKLLLPFRLGLGARFGTGRQYLSWIALADHVRAMRFLLGQTGLAGPVNLTAPAPVTNAELTRALGATLRRPAVLQVPAGALRLALGEMSTELLSSSRVVPTRLEQAGFEFRYPAIGPALAAAVGDGSVR
jgi:uncharacterized protein